MKYIVNVREVEVEAESPEAAVEAVRDGEGTYLDNTAEPGELRVIAIVPAAACPRCGGWANCGGMSQHSRATEPVLGRTGCSCHR